MKFLTARFSGRKASLFLPILAAFACSEGEAISSGASVGGSAGAPRNHTGSGGQGGSTDTSDSANTKLYVCEAAETDLPAKVALTYEETDRKPLEGGALKAGVYDLVEWTQLGAASGPGQEQVSLLVIDPRMTGGVFILRDTIVSRKYGSFVSDSASGQVVFGFRDCVGSAPTREGFQYESADSFVILRNSEDQLLRYRLR